MNKMLDIRIEKITLNIGCGTDTPLEAAKQVLERISGKKVVITQTNKRTTFNVPKNKPIGCKVTIRDNKEDFLRRMLEAKENRLQERNFDNTGNFSFGIKEYIDIPQMEYDPKIGVLGLDVCVTLERPGYRVKKKKISKRIGKGHIIKREEAVKYIREKFSAIIE
ncbi:MAG: 50S ribosomal protein L5 [Candidatus Aenigmarchaeota archaeon]|nr:50S ribosomal protein L5 [Candidatus Aenigmarchaeota archaeon]MDI6722858.1 50S ribosomal protein L5 [Candidatus Aenigmarchaeota archaeon]